MIEDRVGEGRIRKRIIVKSLAPVIRLSSTVKIGSMKEAKKYDYGLSYMYES
jgi:hypothetical protein